MQCTVHLRAHFRQCAHASDCLYECVLACHWTKRVCVCVCVCLHEDEPADSASGWAVDVTARRSDQEGRP